MRTVTAKQMQKIDRDAVEKYGVPSIVLMENAGRGASEIICRDATFCVSIKKSAKLHVVIVCGPGNNGGDGFVVARHLFINGIKPKVFSLVPEKKIKGDAAINCQSFQKMGGVVRFVAPTALALKNADLVVDAIFGIGLSRNVSGIFYETIEKINKNSQNVVSLDVPSGLNADTGEIPQSWYEKAEILKKHPGKIKEYTHPPQEEGIMPIIHCLQEIPCNPCTTVCPTDAIKIAGDPIMGYPEFVNKCIGCGKCVTICPGLAITLVDYRKDSELPTITLAYEVFNHKLEIGNKINVVDIDGNFLENLEITSVGNRPKSKMQLIGVKAPKEIAKKIAGFNIQNKEVTEPAKETILPKEIDDNTMICLCERVTAGEVKKWIKKGVTDLNQLKAITRLGMGPCGAKSCDNLVKWVYREVGVPAESITENVRRPVFIEVPFIKFANGKDGGGK